jgi:hypothetical protein
VTRETNVRLQMPSGDEYEIGLTAEQRETLDAACEYLDMEPGLLVNAACKWGNANNPDLTDHIGHEMGRRARRTSEERKAELQERAKERLLKQRILDFTRHVVENEPDAEWMAGNGELRFGGDLDQ